MSRFGKQQLHELYYYLKLTRSLEEELARFFRAGRLLGGLPISTGQEALGLGVAFSLKPQDLLASSIPSNSAWLARGVSAFAILAHFQGRQGGPTGGRDGSLRLPDWEHGLLAPCGHPATHVGVMAGVALAAKTEGRDSVAVVLVGERALTTGDFHEGFNFATVHGLPLVLVIEKTPVEPELADASAPAGPDHHQRLKSYGAPTVMVDGNDVLQVLQVVETAVGRARDGKGPSVVEARTEGRTRFSMREDIVAVWPETAGRFLGPCERAGAHAQKRQAKLALEDQALNDPVEQFEAFLIEHAQLRPEEQEVIVARVTREIAEGVRRAEEAQPPKRQSLATGVYELQPGGLPDDGSDRRPW